MQSQVKPKRLSQQTDPHTNNAALFIDNRRIKTRKLVPIHLFIIGLLTRLRIVCGVHFIPIVIVSLKKIRPYQDGRNHIQWTRKYEFDEFSST